MQKSEKALLSIRRKPAVVLALLGVLKTMEGKRKEAERFLRLKRFFDIQRLED